MTTCATGSPALCLAQPWEPLSLSEGECELLPARLPDDDSEGVGRLTEGVGSARGAEGTGSGVLVVPVVLAAGGPGAVAAGGIVVIAPAREMTGLAVTTVGAPVAGAREVTAAVRDGEPLVRCDGAAGEPKRISAGRNAGGALEPDALTKRTTGLALASATTTTISHLIRMQQLCRALLARS